MGAGHVEGGGVPAMRRAKFEGNSAEPCFFSKPEACRYDREYDASRAF